MTSWLMATAGIVALLAAPLGVRWLVHWRHQENHAQHAAGAVVPPPRQPEPDWLDTWLPAPLGHALGSIRTYDPVPWEDLQSDARIEDDRDGDQTAAWFHELGEDPGPGLEAVVPADPPPGPVQAPALAPDDSRHDGQREGRALHGLNHAHTCPRCHEPHKEPHCADGREWGPWPPVDAARPWLDVQLEDLYVWVRGVLAA